MTLPARDYESVKSLLQDPDPAVRLRVAGDPNAPPEALFYLAEDTDRAVRMAIARNPATPRLANMVLAKDADYDIRCALAHKLVGDGLSREQRDDFWRLGFTVLEALATDQVVRVRRILADGLKLFADAPRSVILTLSRDPAPEVAVPVIESSPVLEEDDILELVQEAPDWAQQAVARRKDLPAKASAAIAERGAPAAAAELAANEDARIPDETLEIMVDRAGAEETLQEPLARRRAMPGRFLVKLAKTAAAPVLALIRGRDDLDSETDAALGDIAEERARAPAAAKPHVSRAPTRPAKDKPPADEGVPSALQPRSGETDDDVAIRLHKEGRLDDETAALALDRGRLNFVITALALRARLGRMTVRAILDSRSPKAVTALCWKAGFKMRFAVEVQRRLAKVAPNRLLYAREGVSYPMSPEEMTEQIALFTD